MTRLIKFCVLFVVIVTCHNSTLGQGIYLIPSPTNVSEPARLYIDTNSPDCQCDELGDAGPDNPVYIWTWGPSDNRPTLEINGESIETSNGEWTNSNDSLVLTQDETNPSLWYFDFLGVYAKFVKNEM